MQLLLQLIFKIVDVMILRLAPRLIFLSDEYPYKDNIDYIIMNPPYSIIEPFVMRSLGIANKGVLMLGRLQFLEGEKRFENILAEYPPTDIYVYVDRIACFKNGDISQKMSSAQAYAWFYWDLTKADKKVMFIGLDV